MTTQCGGHSVRPPATGNVRERWRYWGQARRNAVPPASSARKVACVESIAAGGGGGRNSGACSQPSVSWDTTAPVKRSITTPRNAAPGGRPGGSHGATKLYVNQPVPGIAVGDPEGTLHGQSTCIEALSRTAPGSQASAWVWAMGSALS